MKVHALALRGLILQDDQLPGQAPPQVASAATEGQAGRALRRRLLDPVQAAAGEEASKRGTLADRFEGLLQSRFEAEGTAGLLEGAFEIDPMLLTKTETTKAALFAAAPGTRYLHLATHGWFAPESVRSIADEAPADSTRMSLEERLTGLTLMTLCGRALAEANRGRGSLRRVPGILTAEELCPLGLSQCELAVPSACETNGRARQGRCTVAGEDGPARRGPPCPGLGCLGAHGRPGRVNRLRGERYRASRCDGPPTGVMRLEVPRVGRRERDGLGSGAAGGGVG